MNHEIEKYERPIELLNTVTIKIADNAGLSERAVRAIEGALTAAPEKIQDILIPDGDMHDEKLADLQGKATEAIQWAKTARMPITKEFDRIKGIFTEQEKAIEAELQKLKQWRQGWAMEKSRRIEIFELEKRKELARKQAETDYRATAATFLANARRQHEQHVLSLITKTFYLCKIDTIDHYEEDMAGVISNIPKHFTVPTPPVPALALPEAVANDIKASAFKAEITDRMGDIVDNAQELVRSFVAKIPARKLELDRASDAELEAEAAAQQQRIKMEADQRAAEELARAEAQRQAESLDNAMAASTLTPTVQQSKGTSKRQKYSPTTHKAFIAIITNWVTGHMATLTIEELTKKLSFMITAANKDLNSGETIDAEGLNIEEDFTVRGARKK